MLGLTSVLSRLQVPGAGTGVEHAIACSQRRGATSCSAYRLCNHRARILPRAFEGPGDVLRIVHGRVDSTLRGSEASQLQLRINSSKMAVPTIETAIDPRQPNRLEKKTNTPAA